MVEKKKKTGKVPHKSADQNDKKATLQFLARQYS